eukprot:567390-Rhodomonas_salina.2
MMHLNIRAACPEPALCCVEFRGADSHKVSDVDDASVPLPYRLLTQYAISASHGKIVDRVLHGEKEDPDSSTSLARHQS